MDKRSIPIAIACALLCTAGLAAYFYVIPAPAQPARVLLENNGGRVVFSHQEHLGYLEGTQPGCATCHHEQKLATKTATAKTDAQGIRACGACHGATDNPAFANSHQNKYLREEGEQSCLTCHHIKFTGLGKNWDHTAHSSYAGDNCQACHHPTATEPAPQACSACHAPGKTAAKVPLRDAAHAKCVSCHEAFFEEKLKGCTQCHEAKPMAEIVKTKGSLELPLPSCVSCHPAMSGRMDTFHKSCAGCHEKLPPSTAAQKLQAPSTKQCDQCHRK